MTSRAWLHAAWTATIVGAAVFAIALMRMTTMSEDTADLRITHVGSTPSLKVAIARTAGGPAEWANWARVVKNIADAVGRPAELRYLTQEDEAVQVLQDDPADVAFVCTHTYLDLKERGVMVGLASPLIDGDQQDTMMVVVRADSRFKELEDLREASLAASQRTSLGGYAYVQWLAKSKGVALDELFGEVRVGETMEQNLRDLLDGEIDATVVNTAQLEEDRLANLRVLAESPPLGAPPVVVSAELDEATRQKVLGALLGMDESKLGTGTRVSGFVALDESDYEFSAQLRNACRHHEDEPLPGAGQD